MLMFHPDIAGQESYAWNFIRPLAHRRLAPDASRLTVFRPGVLTAHSGLHLLSVAELSPAS